MTSVKRIMREWKEMQSDVERQSEPPWIFAEPLGDNLFEWHFTIQGPPDSPYARGLYHGRILLPNEYPFKPPNIYISTPNGRFQVNQKICLNVTGFHPEYWQPAWGIRTVLTALQGFFAVETDGTSVGSVHTPYSTEERLALAKKSLLFQCPKCAPLCNKDILTKAFGTCRLKLDSQGLLPASSNSSQPKIPVEIQFYVPSQTSSVNNSPIKKEAQRLQYVNSETVNTENETISNNDSNNDSNNETISNNEPISGNDSNNEIKENISQIMKNNGDRKIDSDENKTPVQSLNPSDDLNRPNDETSNNASNSTSNPLNSTNATLATQNPKRSDTTGNLLAFLLALALAVYIPALMQQKK